jgi:hypothetical protein
MSKKRGGGLSDILNGLMYLAFISIPIGVIFYVLFNVYETVAPSHS